MKRQYLVVVSAAALFLSSCSATGPKFQSSLPRDGQADIYVYRPSKFKLSGDVVPIQLNGADSGKLKNGGYLHFTVRPGEHLITIPTSFWGWNVECLPIKVQAVSSGEHFVALDVDASVSLTMAGTLPIGVGAYSCQLLTIPKEAALPIIKETKRSD